ncbi:hypothetical protein HY500_02060 [Candidatus Woesearchaeota archaeon]|nr:hypothetical protein [Candidatus Woesearchaeota archaeon]
MKSRFIKRLSALAAVATLSLTSKASADEITAYTGIDTTYVNADSLRIQRNIRTSETDLPLEDYTALPQKQTGDTTGISKYLPKQLCVLFGLEGYKNQFPKNDMAVVGLEFRLTDPSPRLPGTLWLITSGKRGEGESDESYNESGSVHRIGGEVRSNTPIRAIAGCGLDITTSSVRRYDRGRGFYYNAGVGFGPLPYKEGEDLSAAIFPRGYKMMVGGSSKKGRDVSAKLIWSFTD